MCLAESFRIRSGARPQIPRGLRADGLKEAPGAIPGSPFAGLCQGPAVHERGALSDREAPRVEGIRESHSR